MRMSEKGRNKNSNNNNSDNPLTCRRTYGGKSRQRRSLIFACLTKRTPALFFPNVIRRLRDTKDEDSLINF